MPRLIRCLGGPLLLCFGLLGTGCQSPAQAPGAAAPGQAASSAAEGTSDGEVTIRVTSNGWHSEIVVARVDLPTGTIPETADFLEARYLGFGWGDAEYYPAPRSTVGMALRAALWPTPAVVHLAGLRASPSEAFPENETLELRISAQGFQRLLAYLDAAFDRRGGRPAEPVAPGLYRFSRFYPATGEFHLFNTCNTWTAKGLETAGLPIEVSGTIRAEDLMSQLRAMRGAHESAG